jgi:2-(1,2-epoxy-1,2-dihydrophenyl)acetyl-CoA isomerase
MAEPLVFTATEGAAATLILNRPARHNSLVPELLEELSEAIDRLDTDTLSCLVLAANGRSFSTGGDVAGFADLPRGQRRIYADRLLGLLNRVILQLIDCPVPVIARVQGPVTGGSCALVFASDLVAFGPRAFVQSYYVDVGFAPDGGWTALLPDRIGVTRASAIQMLNRRIGAEEAVTLGLATRLVAEEDLDATVTEWTATLAGKVRGSLVATRALLTPPARRLALADALERERERFLALIETDATEAGMARFLGRAA